MLLAIGGVGVAAYLAMRGKSSNQKTIGGDSGGGGEEPQPEEVVFGCTNIYATNYDPIATNDDGSCMYDVPLVDNDILYTPSYIGGRQPYPFMWYWMQSLGIDPTLIDPCNAITTSFGPFSEAVDLGSAAILDTLALLPADDDVQLTGDQLNQMAYDALEGSTYDGPIPVIFDNATGQPNVNFIPYPADADCSTPDVLTFGSYADWRLFVQDWVINTGGDAGESGPINPPVSSLITDTSDPCTLVGWMDTSVLANEALYIIEVTTAQQLGNLMVDQLAAAGTIWNMPSPFAENGTLQYLYSMVEDIPLPNCSAPDTSGGPDGSGNNDIMDFQEDVGTGGDTSGSDDGGDLLGFSSRNMYSNLG